MNIIFITGILGSIILVIGAAWPENAKVAKTQKLHPAKSIKNWLFAIGGLIMLIYAIMGYHNNDGIFFIFLESLVMIASVMMMFGVDDRIDTAVIGLSGMATIVWSLYLFEGYNTVLFILGLTGVGLGYAFDIGTLRRGIALTLGSILIAAFSYIEASWIFFWLNLFFAIFSAYHLKKNL